jgi:hypothetical protein
MMLQAEKYSDHHGAMERIRDDVAKINSATHGRENIVEYNLQAIVHSGWRRLTS